MSTDGAAFLAKILAHPDDDNARLAYADWLEEYGGDAARARFIGAQCELARMPDAQMEKAERYVRENAPAAVPGDMLLRYRELRERERGLVQSHGYHFCEGLLGPGWKEAGRGKAGAIVSVDYYRPGESTKFTGPFAFLFARGFPESLTCTGPDWATHGDAILERAPLRSVHFAGATPTVDRQRYSVMRSVWYCLIAGKWVRVADERVVEQERRGIALSRLFRLALSARWPAVPPEGWKLPSGSEPCGYTTAPPTATQQAWEEAAAVEEATRAVAAAHGVSRSVLTRLSTSRPYVQCACDPPGVPLALSELPESVAPDAGLFSYRTVELRPRRMLRFGGFVVEDGRCACGRVYFAVTRAESPAAAEMLRHIERLRGMILDELRRLAPGQDSPRLREMQETYQNLVGQRERAAEEAARFGLPRHLPGEPRG